MKECSALTNSCNIVKAVFSVWAVSPEATKMTFEELCVKANDLKRQQMNDNRHYLGLPKQVDF